MRELRGAVVLYNTVAPHKLHLKEMLRHLLSLQTSPAPLQTAPVAVVNMTPLIAHAAEWSSQGGWAGQHSDVNLPPLYELLARFFGNG